MSIEAARDLLHASVAKDQASEPAPAPRSKLRVPGAPA